MRIIYLPEVNSTSTYLKEHPELPSGTAVLAGRQTAGRGRLGRSFHSPEGLGMYLSVALDMSDALMLRLTPAAAVAGRRAIARVGLCCGIKWVNDLVCEREGRLRKLCGILAETRGARAVLGVGIDLLQRADDFPPELRDICTSVAAEGGEAVSPREMAEIFLEELDAALALDGAALFDEYARSCVTVGRAVEVRRTPEAPARQGRAVALGEDFSLRVEFEDGSIEDIASGEASVKPSC